MQGRTRATGMACRNADRKRVEEGRGVENTQTERVGKGSSSKPARLERRRTWPGKIDRTAREGRVRAVGKRRRKSFGYKITPANQAQTAARGRVRESAGTGLSADEIRKCAWAGRRDCKNDDKIARLIPLLVTAQLHRVVDVVVIKSSRTMKDSHLWGIFPISRFRWSPTSSLLRGVNSTIRIFLFFFSFSPSNVALALRSLGRHTLWL